jgi:hypothetical protein
MKKNWLFAVISAVFIIFKTFNGIFELSDEGVQDHTHLVPVYSLSFDMIYLYIIAPTLIMMIFIQVFSVILSLGFYKLHNTLKLKKYDYFILSDVGENESHFLVIIRRAVILGLLSLSLGMFLYELIPEEIVISTSSDVIGTIPPIQYVSTTGVFILPFLILVLAPIWLLRDSGIMCKRNIIRKERRQLPDIEGVYNYFESNITGYVGIGAIITLILLMFESVSRLDFTTGEIGDIPDIFLTPVYLILMVFPAIVFYEYRLRTLREKLVARFLRKGLKSVEKVEDFLNH